MIKLPSQPQTGTTQNNDNYADTVCSLSSSESLFGMDSEEEKEWRERRTLFQMILLVH
jgi:hypothetical protein